MNPITIEADILILLARAYPESMLSDSEFSEGKLERMKCMFCHVLSWLVESGQVLNWRMNEITINSVVMTVIPLNPLVNEVHKIKYSMDIIRGLAITHKIMES